MSDQCIIFKNDNGGVSVIYPTEEGIKRAGGDIHKIARKDVPAGKPYKVEYKISIPTDRTYREAWTIDDAELTDGIGSDSNEFEV